MSFDTKITLYKLSLRAICKQMDSVHLQTAQIKLLPPSVMADVLVTMTEFELWERLFNELNDVDCLVRILKFNSEKRQLIIKCISQLMDRKRNICEKLCKSYESQLTRDLTKAKHEVESGLILGGFLAEIGWLSDALIIIDHVVERVDLMADLNPSYENLLLALACNQKLLFLQSAYCFFRDASYTTAKALNLIDRMMNSSVHIKAPPSSAVANLYHQISVLHFHRSEYDLSYEWSCRAVSLLRDKDTPERISVDVLRQAAKACVVKRRFDSADILIKQALQIAMKSFGTSHQKYSDVLLDYGFFLLNIDSITRSVYIYEKALTIKKEVFGNNNLNVAVAHEDLAYALYVQEYSSGHFESAEEHIKAAINIMLDLVPDNHLMQASAKRVKALILEEIALDLMANGTSRDQIGLDMLREAEDLHLSALQLSLEAFGEINVQTAKHYGNLGRLYQSMNQFDKAEKMHLRAIDIKTDLLGKFDYEVGLSIGHLASLYNYHMHKHREAEKLYLQSITINLRLFGPAYSGLEYDYRGLCHVYEMLEDRENLLKYSDISEDWRARRAQNDERRKIASIEGVSGHESIEELLKTFFKLNQEVDLRSQTSLLNKQ